jgi:cell division protein FtsB
MAGYAVAGGEYGTGDLLAMRREVRDEQARIADLRHQIDSVARQAQALRTDPKTQERVAREVYGMIRPGELLYQVVQDTAR